MKIVGNQKALRLLNKQLMNRKFGHAYLFIGPEGVGKFDLALQFAREVNGSDAGPVNQDLKIIEQEIIEEKGKIRKKEISIQQIREGLHFLNLSSIKNKHRILIIQAGENMNVRSQNAILKSIEEPDEKSIVIIVAKNVDRLLPTVISRCQRIGFGLVKKEDLLEAFGKEQKDIERITALSLGRPAWMEKMLNEPGEVERRESIKKDLDMILSGNNNQKMKIIERISRDKELAKENIDLWIAFARQNTSFFNAGKNNRVSAQCHLIEKLIDGLSNISKTNANPRLVLESLVII